MSIKTAGKTATQAQNRYIVKAYDRISVLVAKGNKDRIAARAAEMGESVNGYITRLIAEDMQKPEH